MEKIRKLKKEDLETFCHIARRAYPGMEIKDFDKFVSYIEKSQTENEHLNYYGCFRDNLLVGGMRIHDFEMNLFNQIVTSCGVGFLAVDLLHKKEGICKEMITFFLEYGRKRKASVAVLYAFRPDFYQNMGFGYGTRIHSFSVRPDSFPRSKTKKHLAFAGKEHLQTLVDYHNEAVRMNHGMMMRYEHDFRIFFNNPAYNVVVFRERNRILGYMIFRFRNLSDDNFVLNDLEVIEMVYSSRKVLAEFCTFFHTQQDQVRRINLLTQDEDILFLLKDVRNDSGRLYPSVYHECYRTGTGMMYKILDLQDFFAALKEHSFGKTDCTVKFNLADSFSDIYSSSIIIRFKNGSPLLKKDGKFDVELKSDISVFSSIATGALNISNAWQYNLVELSDPDFLPVLEEIFGAERKPVCNNWF